jgi:hypothetical protein
VTAETSDDSEPLVVAADHNCANVVGCDETSPAFHASPAPRTWAQNCPPSGGRRSLPVRPNCPRSPRDQGYTKFAPVPADARPAASSSAVDRTFRRRTGVSRRRASIAWPCAISRLANVWRLDAAAVGRRPHLRGRLAGSNCRYERELAVTVTEGPTEDMASFDARPPGAAIPQGNVRQGQAPGTRG